MIIFTEGTAWNGVNVFRRNKHINETIQKNIRVKKKMKNKEREERRGERKKEREKEKEKKKKGKQKIGVRRRNAKGQIGNWRETIVI